MKFLSSCCVVLCASVGLGQDFSKPITFTTKAEPVRIALDEISKQGGVKLQVEQDMENEPVILRLNAVPTKEVMDRLADVFAADWVDHHGYWQLERSEQKEAAIKQEAFQRKVNAFRKSIDDLVKLEANNPPMTPEEVDKMFQHIARVKDHAYSNDTGAIADRHALESCYPSMRLCIKTLAKMDPVELAKIGQFQRVVFSSSPNAMQEALPTIDADDLQEFIRQRKLMNDGMKKANLKLDWFSDLGATDESKLVSTKPARLIVDTQSFTSRLLLLNFNLYDDKGKVLATDGEELGMTWDENIARRVKRAQLVRDVQQNGYALGPVATELASRTGKELSQLRPISKEAFDALAHPTIIDPLAIATSDTLLIGAARDSLNVIALPEDDVEFDALSCDATGKTSLERFQASLFYTQSTLDISNGWVVLKPQDPALAAEGREPRSTLESFLNECVDKGYVSIESEANLVVNSPRACSWGVADGIAGYLLNTSGGSIFGNGDDEPLRFYGTLSDEQRDVARKDTLNLNLSQLSDEQKSILESMIFDSQMSFVGTTTKSADVLIRERTEMLPNGFPAGTRVSVHDQFKDVVYVSASTADGHGYSYPTQLEYVGGSILRQLKPQLFPPMSEAEKAVMSVEQGWLLGKQRIVQIRLDYDGKYYSENDISEDHRPTGAAMDAKTFMASLSPEMQAKIEKQMAEIEDRLTHRQSDGAPTSSPGAVPPR